MREVALVLLVVAGVVSAGCIVDPPAADSASVTPAAPVEEDLAGAAVSGLRNKILDAAATGAEVTLFAAPERDTLGLASGFGTPLPFNLTLVPSAMVTNETWAEVDGVRVAFPWVRVFEGSVAGSPDQIARVVVAENWIRGTIRISDSTWVIRIGLNGNLPFPTPAAPAGNNTTGLSRTANGPSPGAAIDGVGWEEQSCLSAVPPHTTPMTEMGKSTAAPIVARIVLDGDAQYFDAMGGEAFPLMVAMLAEVDSIYDYEVGIRFELVGIHHNTDPEYYPDPLDEAPLAKLADYWNARKDVDRDVVHIFTGQPSNYAQANCIGGAGVPEVGYTFTPLNWEAETAVFHQTAFAHELGHIFSAHHHYGNHVESWTDSGGRPGGAPRGATLMIQGYTPGAKPVFGTLEKSVIRGWAETYITEGNATVDLPASAFAKSVKAKAAHGHLH